MGKTISVLMVATGAARMTNGEATGVWLEEFAVPYQAFRDAGYEVVVATPAGGEVPVDPRSIEEREEWRGAQAALAGSVPLGEVAARDFDAIFLPGGHGVMFDLADNTELAGVLRQLDEKERVISAVCHGPAALVNATRADGTPLVAGRRITGFTNAEEEAAGHTAKMPFLLESRLRELGAEFVPNDNWANHVEVDGRLITGQNPQSSASIARAVIAALGAAPLQ